MLLLGPLGKIKGKEGHKSCQNKFQVSMLVTVLSKHMSSLESGRASILILLKKSLKQVKSSLESESQVHSSGRQMVALNWTCGVFTVGGHSGRDSNSAHKN